MRRHPRAACDTAFAMFSSSRTHLRKTHGASHALGPSRVDDIPFRVASVPTLQVSERDSQAKIASLIATLTAEVQF